MVACNTITLPWNNKSLVGRIFQDLPLVITPVNVQSRIANNEVGMPFLKCVTRESRSSHFTKLSTFVPEYEVCCTFIFAHHFLSFVFVTIASVSSSLRLDCPRFIFLPPIVYQLLDRINASTVPRVDRSEELFLSSPLMHKEIFTLILCPLSEKISHPPHHQNRSHSHRHHLPCNCWVWFINN